MNNSLCRYRELIRRLNDARRREDETEEDLVEDEMTILWDELTPEERKQTDVWAPEGFPELLR